MTTLTVEQSLENVYNALHNNNQGLDIHIAELKSALAQAGQKSVNVDPARIYQNNRQGRKLMQSYFKQRGVIVEFTAAA